MSAGEETYTTIHEPLIAPEGTPEAPGAGIQEGGLAGPAGSRSLDKAPAAPMPGTHVQGILDMETLIGYILLAGVLTSITLILAGLAWHWARTGEIGVRYQISGMTFFEFLLSGLRQVFSDQYRPRLLVSLGITTLMLTPFVRVLASMVYFAFAARNWKYTVFTGFVLAVLSYSLFLR